MSGPKKDKFGRNEEIFIIIVLMICPTYQILLTVRDRMPVGMRFSGLSDPPWGPLSLL
jgi:hypothetical protein